MYIVTKNTLSSNEKVFEHRDLNKAQEYVDRQVPSNAYKIEHWTGNNVLMHRCFSDKIGNPVVYIVRKV